MTEAVARGLTPSRVTLDNGAVVITQETTTTPAVTIDATFYAGSFNEPPDIPGVAFLTARVLDRGTERRSADRLAEELDDRGVTLRLATTRHTFTISCTCLAEDFDEMLALVIDVARRPTFPQAEIDKRRAETITAIRQDDDNPAVRAVESALQLMYGDGHPYARRAKGTLDSVERVRRDDLVRFHRDHLVPAALCVAIVGDVRRARAFDRAAAELEDWTAAAPSTVDVPPPAAAPTRRRRVIALPGKSQTDIAYGFPTIRRLDPRFYAYWLMNNVLGQFGLGGRLADNIRERQGMAYYAFSSCEPNVGEGPLMIRAGVDPKNVDRAIDAIDVEVRTLAAEGPTATEAAESRDYLIGSLPRMLETNQGIAAFLQNAEQFGLGLDYDQRLPSLIAGVTIDEIAAAAAEALRPDAAAIAIAGPHEAGE